MYRHNNVRTPLTPVMPVLLCNRTRPLHQDILLPGVTVSLRVQVKRGKTGKADASITVSSAHDCNKLMDEVYSTETLALTTAVVGMTGTQSWTIIGFVCSRFTALTNFLSRVIWSPAPGDRAGRRSADRSVGGKKTSHDVWVNYETHECLIGSSVTGWMIG